MGGNALVRWYVVSDYYLPEVADKRMSLRTGAPCVWYASVSRSSYPNNLCVQCEMASNYHQSNIVVMRIKDAGHGHDIASEDWWSLHHRVKPVLHPRNITRSRRFHLVSSSGRRSIAQRRKISTGLS